jgi:hypothetical protein
MPGTSETHCSVCGRRLREKVYFVDFAGKLTDWLNHNRECPRYGLLPDSEVPVSQVPLRDSRTR